MASFAQWHVDTAATASELEGIDGAVHIRYLFVEA